MSFLLIVSDLIPTIIYLSQVLLFVEGLIHLPILHQNIFFTKLKMQLDELKFIRIYPSPGSHIALSHICISQLQ